MNKNPIILFDGICNFCNYWVNLIIRNDKKNIFLFAPLQTEAGKKIRSDFPGIETEADSVILIMEGKYYLRSEAAIRIAKILGGKWLIAYYLLKIIPGFIRDGIYDIIASNRYRWFGKRKECVIPGKNVREKFLS